MNYTWQKKNYDYIMAISPATKARKIADREARKLEKNKMVKIKKAENAKAKGKVWNPSTQRWVSEAHLKKYQQKIQFKPSGPAIVTTPTFQKKFNIPKQPSYHRPPGGRRIDFKPNNVREINNRYLTYKTPVVSRTYNQGTFVKSRHLPRPAVHDSRFLQSRYVDKFRSRQTRVKQAVNQLKKQETNIIRAQQNKNRVQQDILRETNNTQKNILIRKKNEIDAYINNSKKRIINLREKVKAESNRLYAHSTLGRGL